MEFSGPRGGGKSIAVLTVAGVPVSQVFSLQRKGERVGGVCQRGENEGFRRCASRRRRGRTRLFLSPALGENGRIAYGE